MADVQATAAPGPVERRDFARAKALIRQDLQRRFLLEGRAYSSWRVLSSLLRPCVLGVVLFRLAEWRHARGSRVQVKLIELLMYYLAHVEIHAGASIGPGLVLPEIGGVGIPRFAQIGRNCTFLGAGLLTVGGIEGVDLASARIVLGDHCVVGHRVRLLGAVTLGDGAQIKENAVVITSFPNPGTLISGVPARRRGTLPLSDIQRWNPLKGVPL